MEMQDVDAILEFINGNGILMTFVGGLLVAIINAISKRNSDRRLLKNDSVKKLKKELEQTKQELSKYKEAQAMEQLIDKTHGDLYIETLSNGEKRFICGHCWEKNHIKNPLITEMWPDNNNVSRESAYCNFCKTRCYNMKD